MTKDQGLPPVDPRAMKSYYHATRVANRNLNLISVQWSTCGHRHLLCLYFNMLQHSPIAKTRELRTGSPFPAHCDFFYGGALELLFQSPNIRLMVEQTTIIILANKTDPHLSAANVSFSEHAAAASDEWTCLLCSVWCRLARRPALKHLTWILTVKQLQMSPVWEKWRGGLGKTEAFSHYFSCSLILCSIFHDICLSFEFFTVVITQIL